MDTTSKRNFYNLDEIKEIPIVEVCRHFGLKLDLKGREPLCSIRPEDKTPSAVLHVEGNGKYRANTFHDFGSGQDGDVVSLACIVLGYDDSSRTDRYRAIEYLANAFGIAPQNKHETNELTNREYYRLGLYANNAVKNFSFNAERQSIENMAAISEKYNMPMNELKKKYPLIYEKLLKKIAIPAFNKAKTDYAMGIWLQRKFLREIYGPDKNLDNVDDFIEDLRDIQATERALIKAMNGTNLTPPKPMDYDPKVILEQIDSGELKLNFGGKTYKQMQHLAEVKKTSIKYKALKLSDVFFDGKEHFQNIPYSAFLSGENAMVGYLECDKERLQPIFQELATPEIKKNNSITDKINDAKIREAAQIKPQQAHVPLEKCLE